MLAMARRRTEARLASSTGPSEDVEGEVGAGDRIKITATWDGSVGQPEVDGHDDQPRPGLAGATRRSAFVADGFNGAVFRQTPSGRTARPLPVAEYDRRARVAAHASTADA